MDTLAVGDASPGEIGRQLELPTNLAAHRVNLLTVCGLVLLREAGDEGEHAIDPDAPGRQDGYVLGNGQNDVYPSSE